MVRPGVCGDQGFDTHLTYALWTKTTKVVRWFLLTNRQFQEVGHCRRHIFGPILPKFYVEFEKMNSSCDNLRLFCN